MTEPLRVMVVDDEAPARQRLADLIAAEPDLVLVGAYADPEEAVVALQRAPPDLLFLDIQMPGLDGFDVLEQLSAEALPVTVFVTAYDRHALRAFEVGALDYLLKPFSDERFEAAIGRARGLLRTRASSALDERLLAALERYRGAAGRASVPEPDGPPPLDRLVIKQAGRVTLLPVEQIDWIEAAGVYVWLHVGAHRHLLRETIGGLETRLGPLRFARIHRSSLVAIDRIRELQADARGEYEVVLSSGVRLRLSRGYRATLERRLGQKL